MHRVALAFDLGGTALRAALVDAEGRVLAFHAVATRANDGPDAVVGQMGGLAAHVAAARPDLQPIGVGVAAAGPLDPEAGIVTDPPTLAGWRDVPLARMLEGLLSLPVRLENDANAAALGEWRFGAGRGTRSMVFVTVSTGIGGGIIADGRLLRGRRGMAGEIGHMTIASESPRCLCGQVGCFEALASGSALGRRATAETAAGDGSMLRQLSSGGAVTGQQVIEAARAGDGHGLDLVARQARYLGIGFANLLHLYSPDIVVMGGGIANGFDVIAPTAAAVMRQRAMPAFRDVALVRAEIGEHAGLAGAASLVLT
jgi:glucokinase